MKPNAIMCEGCPHWDDINGCWADCENVCTRGYVDEDGNFDGDAYDEEN